MQLGLGTAQFGLNYGVTNPGGRTPPGEVARILQHARREGVTVLDTAASYGNSEAVLGGALTAGHSFRIVTKTPRFDSPRITRSEVAALRNACEKSLANLRQDRLYALLVHTTSDLLRPGGELLWETMSGIKREGLVERIGVSVYSGQDIDSVLDRFRPDLVQVPLNALDQRLVRSGHLSRMKARQVEIHARSIFLQGLLLSSEPALPAYFAPFRADIGRAREFCRRHDVSAPALALGFVKSVPEIDVAIVGVASLGQLEQVTAAFRGEPLSAADYAPLGCDDEKLLNPSLWTV